MVEIHLKRYATHPVRLDCGQRFGPHRRCERNIGALLREIAGRRANDEQVSWYLAETTDAADRASVYPVVVFCDAAAAVLFKLVWG